MISKEVNQKFRDPLQRTDPQTSPGARTDRAASHNLSEKGTGGSTHSRNRHSVGPSVFSSTCTPIFRNTAKS